MATLDQAMKSLPLSYPGPGGAAAVLQNGEILVRAAWGYADLDKRLAFTPETLFRICSISKQFTCSLMLDRFPDPAALDADVAARLPNLQVPPPTATHLAHNQSGLRDYWAAAMLCGSPAEAPFGQAESDRVIALSRSLHFTPGTRYSYCNQNFRILGEVVAARLGQSFESLLRNHVWDPAGMPTAQLCADTSHMPDGTIGYEGNPEIGFRAAVNNIHWTGDAGLGCSLDDMIAWERFIDTTRDDAGGIYRRLSAPVTFADGTPATYGFGLSRVKLHGISGTGHGGGLRGWRSFRCNLPSERISIVVLFNHMADARAAALDLLATLVDAPARRTPTPSDPAWDGAWQEPETGLVARLQTSPDHRVDLHFSGLSPETLTPQGDALEAGQTRLHRDANGLRMDRAGDQLSSILRPVSGDATPDIEGIFHSDEYDCRFTCTAAGHALYGAFTGFLGQGTMQQLIPVGPDLWRLPMPRALDHSPPGDWTLQFARDAAGQVASVEIGCWLARRVIFRRE